MAETPRQTFERSQERKRTARPRDLEGDYRAREDRKAARRARGEAPRSEEATSIDEALEAEREAGRREGGGGPKPATSTPSPARGINISQYSGGSVPGVTVPMMIDIGIITLDEIAVNKRLPVPSRLLVAFVLFGGLGLAKNTQAARAAGWFAWGIVIATFYGVNLQNGQTVQYTKDANGNITGYAPGSPQPAAISAINALAWFLAGGNSTKSAPAAASGTGANPGVNGPPPINPNSPAGPVNQTRQGITNTIGGIFKGIVG